MKAICICVWGYIRMGFCSGEVLSGWFFVMWDCPGFCFLVELCSRVYSGALSAYPVRQMTY